MLLYKLIAKIISITTSNEQLFMGKLVFINLQFCLEFIAVLNVGRSNYMGVSHEPSHSYSVRSFGILSNNYTIFAELLSDESS
jgi:hypothetical protein